MEDHAHAAAAELAQHVRALNNRAACLMQAERFLAAAGDAAGAATARTRAESDLARAMRDERMLPEAFYNRGVLSLRAADEARQAGRTAEAALRALQAEAVLEQALARAPADWPHLRACQARLAEAAAARGAGG